MAILQDGHRKEGILKTCFHEAHFGTMEIWRHVILRAEFSLIPQAWVLCLTREHLNQEEIKQDNSPLLSLCHSLDFIFHLVSLSIDWLEVQKKSQVILKYNLSINWKRWRIAGTFLLCQFALFRQNKSETAAKGNEIYKYHFIHNSYPLLTMSFSTHSVIAGRLKVRWVDQ